ncbi:MAG: hypothetical protein P1V35_02215 [Planctomycetota bacterium]|nr:hypothetical protein [Planctomycetota bacterium]
MLATLLLPLFLAAPLQDRPTATELVDQARAYVPKYSGEHRAFLTTTQELEVQAASHIMSAAWPWSPKTHTRYGGKVMLTPCSGRTN